MALKLGELLLKAQLINQQQLTKALDEQKSTGGKLGEILQRLGYVTEDDIIECLSHQFGVPSINLRHFEIDPNVAKIIPVDLARKYNVIPVNKTGATLTLAMTDPTNIFAMDEITFMTGYRVEPVVASEEAIRERIDRNFGSSRELELKKVMEDLTTVDEAALELMEEEEELDVAKLAEESQEAPVVRLVNIMLTDAIKRGASDIHVEPYEKSFRVRYRIDGLLREVMNPPQRLKDAITSRIKVLAKLDIAEKRLPQDGRIKLKAKIEGRMRELDFRVSVLPTLHGEKIVMRLLDKENLRLDMTKLGFEKSSLKKFEDNILKPYGMILVTGPTGSGKTNTLYSALQRVNVPETNIITAEDPVEFQLPGVNQVQMKDSIGLNFAAALRSFLRQDPNIILVGEIRDFETAEIAIKAALTGHLVLSTLHTNDAPATISRLMNMGIEPFLVATSVNVIAAQRLIRKVCQSCKEEIETPIQALLSVGFPESEAHSLKLVKGRGCDKCTNSGYKGRLGLFEVMDITEDMRELILSGATAVELRRKAIEEGMITLRQSGLQKIREGLTTIDEVVRETVL
ncbi:MAG: type IV-A pilus assembly ATPase PilB [Acidobacteria bacterium 21-70-11]|nr:MAG: type IV-A pilus assembly ATPase PilB [Acidobacteria bacterium 21-70-11]HQT94192.1 type IV-A pilus assembly ATPase PilB [Thermoanaerobaculaceae bacterium]HQU33314.1 type IV-A pilus assembly ATPase PilB [Thermoanaerobaculaceae bacterium]